MDTGNVFSPGQRDIRKALRDVLDNNMGELEQDQEEGYTEDKYLGRLARRVSNRIMKPIDFSKQSLQDRNRAHNQIP